MAVTISPNPVAPGQTLQVGFSGYAPNGTVFPYFIATQSTPLPVSAGNNSQAIQLNAQGGGVWNVTILTTTPVGNYTLHILDGSTSAETTHIIQIQTIVSYSRITRFVDAEGHDLVNGSIVEVGETIHATLIDYPPNKAVDVLIQSLVIGSGTTAFNGNASFPFTINKTGTFDLRINEHGNGTDYGQIMVTVKYPENPDPDPLPGEIDPLWIIGGIVALGGVALVASGGLKKIPKIL